MKNRRGEEIVSLGTRCSEILSPQSAVLPLFLFRTDVKAAEGSSAFGQGPDFCSPEWRGAAMEVCKTCSYPTLGMYYVTKQVSRGASQI